MIKRYRIGNPINTESVIKEVPIEAGDLFGFSFDKETLTYKKFITKNTVIYGLGETTRGINKRGFKYVSYCADDPNHTEDKNSLYAAQNFFILDDGKEPVAYYFDFPGEITFDMGFTELNTVSVTLSELNFDLYVITGPDKKTLVREFRGIIGQSYIAPKWAFGYGQSRWSYFTADEVREVVKKYREAGIPIDSVYLDIDYLDDYKDFTVSETAFPDFDNFVKEMKEEGIHLVPIIDAAVKVKEGYDVCEEGLEKGYFCKDKDGNAFTAAVWPGQSYLPDFLNKDARKWFGDKYKFLLDKGIEGFWNDMNEPAIFYSKERLDKTFEKVEEYKSKNLDIDTFFELTGLFPSLSNNREDYRSFFHNMDGEMVCHDRVHNLYGYNMTRSASEAFARIVPDKKILMFSRSSYIGLHRYGGIWTGDNKSWWSHLLLNVQQLPALNMCGFLYSGADTGGFGADCSKDLMMRWLSVSMFTPLFRNHAAKGTRRQELYEFGDIKEMRELIKLRYALIPYLYSEYLKAVKNNDCLFMPLSFEYKDGRVNEIEDQLLVGESIMIAPVTKQNATGRYAYLPEDMKLIRFRGPKNYDEEILEAGDHYVKADLNEVLVFIRPGHSLPLCDSAEYVEKLDYSTIRFLDYKCRKPYEIVEE